MKIGELLSNLEQIRIADENCDYIEMPGFTAKLIIQALILYIGNPKIEDKINEIPF